MYVTMARAGEESGRLNETISEMAEYQARQNELASKIKTAVAYPAFMAFFGVGTVIFILTFVLPKLTVVFNDLGQALPGPTVFVMRVSDLFIEQWPWLGLIVVVGMWFSKQWDKSAEGRAFKSNLNLHAPLWGSFLLKVELTRFCRTLQLLLKSGVSILRAIQLSIPLINNDLIRAEFIKSQQSLAAGKSFGESIKQIGFIPPIMGHLIAVGEESGTIESTLLEVAEAFEQETGETLKLMTTFLEPLLIVVVGSIIGFIVLAMLLPIFQLDIFAR
jgi:type II secretory pathway component PulF